MRGILSPFHKGAQNLALEEALYEGCDLPTLLFWISDPCVVIGRNQNAFVEADVGYCVENNIPVLRRISGGGAVYHDGGNLNCSMILPVRGEQLSYDVFLDAYTRAINDLGIPARRSGICDVYLGEKKLCGTAQAARGTRTLTHATLLCDTDLTQLSLSLRKCPAEITGKFTASVRVPVTNCGLSTEGLAEKIGKRMGVTEFSVPGEMERKAMETFYPKYTDFAWNYGKSLPFTARSGDILLRVEKGIIVESTLAGLMGKPYLPGSLPENIVFRFFNYNNQGEDR